MKWVKANERLPEKGKYLNGKLQGRPVIVCNSNLVEGYITANGNLEPVNLVEWLEEQANDYEGYEDWNDERDCLGSEILAYKQIIKELKTRPEAQEQKPIWIKVEDDLPLNGTCVLALLKNDNNTDAYDVVTFFAGHFVGQTFGYEVTHWMPLPDYPNKSAIQKPITDEEINKMAWQAWEYDAKTNPNSINPHPFVYGYKIAFKAALSYLYDKQ